MATPKQPIVKGKAADVLKAAQDKIEAELMAGYTVKLEELYRRRANAEKVLAGVEKEIEIYEAEIKRELG